MARVFDAPYTDVRSEPANPAEPAQAEPSRYSFLMSFVILFAVAIAGFFLVTTQNVSAAPEPVPANDYNQRVGYVEETDVPLELYQGAPVEQDTLPTPTLFILPTTQPTDPFPTPGDNMVTPAAPVVTMPAYPTIQPAPTFDAEAEARRIELDDKAARLEIERQFQALKIERERDELARQQQMTALIWIGIFALGAGAFVAFVAIIHAYVISAVKAVKAKPAPKPAEPVEPVDTVTALVEKAKDEWLDMVDWKTGKTPLETADVDALFGSQDEYRSWMMAAVRAGLIARGSRGWLYITDDFAARVGRKIGNP